MTSEPVVPLPTMRPDDASVQLAALSSLPTYVVMPGLVSQTSNVPCWPIGDSSGVLIACSVTWFVTVRSNMLLWIGGGVFQP